MHQIPGGGVGVNRPEERGGTASTLYLDLVGPLAGRLEMDGEHAAVAVLPYKRAKVEEHSHVVARFLTATSVDG